jgi:WD40 repeat protein
MDRKVRIWSAEDGRKLHELSGHDGDVFAVAFHPDSRALVSGDLYGNVHQWDVTTGQKTRSFDCRALYTVSRLQDVGGVRCLVFNGTGGTLACAGTRPSGGGNVQGVPTILNFDWANGRLQHTLAVGAGGDGFVYDLAFHNAGFVMAVTSGNPGTGRFFFHRPGDNEPFFNHTRMPNCHSLAVHPDGKRLVVAATNAGSNGNGRPLRNGEYPGNFSPLHVWEMPST